MQPPRAVGGATKHTFYLTTEKNRSAVLPPCSLLRERAGVRSLPNCKHIRSVPPLPVPGRGLGVRVLADLARVCSDPAGAPTHLPRFPPICLPTPDPRP